MSEENGGPLPDQYELGVVEADFSGLDLAGEASGPDETAVPPADPPSGPEIPEGMTVDRATGEVRAKRRSGRPRKDPAAPPAAAGPPPAAPPAPPPSPPEGRRPVDREPDREPGPPAKRQPDPADVPSMPRAGVIAAGVNKLYRRAGKIIRGFDRDIGSAVIESTRADDETEWPTVGEAWENLARTNPEVRAFIMRAIAGQGWWELAMAHAPIGLAIMLKPAVQRVIPFGRLIASMAEDDEDGEGGIGGMSAEAAEAIAAQFGMDAAQIAQMAANGGGLRISPEVAARAAQKAAEGSGLTPPFVPPPDGTLPAGFQRQQPKRTTRATRAKAKA